MSLVWLRSRSRPRARMSQTSLRWGGSGDVLVLLRMLMNNITAAAEKEKREQSVSEPLRAEK